jgi:hypothetical protein
MVFAQTARLHMDLDGKLKYLISPSTSKRIGLLSISNIMGAYPDLAVYFDRAFIPRINVRDQ